MLPINASAGLFAASGNITAGVTPSVGNGCIITISANGGKGFASLIDNQGGGSLNIWTRVAQGLDASGGNSSASEIWYCPAIFSAAGAYTLAATSNAPGEGATNGWSFLEVPGRINLDVPSSGGDAAGANTNLILTNAQANSLPGGIAVATCNVLSDSASAFQSTPPSAGYVGTVEYYGNLNGVSVSAGYKNLPSIETSLASWFWTTATRCSGALATFKAVPLITPFYSLESTEYF